MTKPEQQSNYWLDVAADEIIAHFPEGEIVVSSGISPSASYHIGHFREIMTADALAWVVRQRGRKARHIHVVDNFDPLRKWYDFLPPADKDYAGHPLALVPDPIGDCHDSYAEHFYAEFEASLEPMGIGGEDFQIIKAYQDLYKPGHMTKYIEQAMGHLPEIRKVFEKLSNRELPETWTPVQVLGEDGKFQKADATTWNKDKQTLNGRGCDKGGAKLDWRLDWPARWAYFGVNVEPFGNQEHGAAGSSYDTGQEFARNVFGVEPPLDTGRYGHIHRPGEPYKMSSSKGNGVTPKEALAIMPPEALRYFIVRGRPENKIYFDTGIGLYNLLDEFAAAGADPDHEFRDAYNFAIAGQDKQVISTIPFKHLVQVYQAARENPEKTLDDLERGGYADAVKIEREIILAELPFVKNWLENYAPDEVKFSVQEKLPKVDLSDEQTTFLNGLADAIEKIDADIDGEAMHKLIYDTKEAAGLETKAAFQAIYQIILGKNAGPKAGWFLSSLDRDWLIKRLRQEA